MLERIAVSLLSSSSWQNFQKTFSSHIETNLWQEKIDFPCSFMCLATAKNKFKTFFYLCFHPIIRKVNVCLCLCAFETWWNTIGTPITILNYVIRTATLITCESGPKLMIAGKLNVCTFNCEANKGRQQQQQQKVK